MGTRDPRVDAYIDRAAPFARPILTHLREVVHAACPAVEETMKWSAPHFQHQGMLCRMAAFKQHCAFGFWKAELIAGLADQAAGEEAAGHFGRITSLADLPPDAVIAGYVREAARLNEAGARAPHMERRVLRRHEPAVVPPDLAAALDADERARAAFDAFPPGQQREYVEWLTEAKTAATRERRLATAVEWIAEGKTRNWKYQKQG